MVAQAVESPAPQGPWEKETTPMLGIRNMDQPLSLVKTKGKFEEQIVEDIEDVEVQTVYKIPKNLSGPSVTFTVKPALHKLYHQRNGHLKHTSEGPRGKINRQLQAENPSEYQEPIGNSSKNQQQIGNASKYQNGSGNPTTYQNGNTTKSQLQIGEASKSLPQEPVDLKSKKNVQIPKSDLGSRVYQEIPVLSRSQVDERKKQMSDNLDQENYDKEDSKLQKSRTSIPDVIQLSKDELDLQERENASEGATTLLLLADGRHQIINQSPERAEVYPHCISGSEPHSPERAEVYPECISGSEPNDDLGNHNPEGSRVMADRTTSSNQRVEDSQNPPGRENEEFSGDEDDPDGVLLVDLDESSEVAYENKDQDELDAVNPSEGNIAKDDRGGKLGNNAHSRSNNRSESKKKMEDGKLWLQNFMVVAGSLSIVKLSDIEDSYLEFCQKNGKEPLATPVLARLIHTLFPGAEKCRLGARGNQRIHYRNLKFKSEGQIGKEPSKINNLNEDKPQKSVNLTENTKGTQPNVSENHNAQKESAREEYTDEQSEENVPCENGRSLQNQTGTGESPKKLESQAIPSQDDEESCKASAKKLSEVLQWISNQGENHKKALLRDFAHSASCQAVRCLPVCMMFRRVRRHVVAAKHCCSVLRLYSMLLRNHVSSCTSEECGLPACPALRRTRTQKRPLELDEHQPAKRAAVKHGQGLPRPSSFVLGPRSPEGSLPGSPVNSPPLSPEELPSDGNLQWELPPGGVQYILVPVVPIVKNQAA